MTRRVKSRSETDPAGNQTTYSYTDKFFTDNGSNPPATYTPTQSTNAYVTSLSDAIGTGTMGYYFGSGNAAIATDYNGVPTYSHYQDPLDRQTEEIDAIGWKLATYSSSTQSDTYSAVGDISASAGCTGCQHSQTIMDTWGRKASSFLVNPPSGCSSPVEVDFTYDSNGRLYQQSHPYCGSGDPNNVSDRYGYDGLNRAVVVSYPDSQAEETYYGLDIGSLNGATAQQGSASTYGYGYPAGIE